MSAVMTVIVWMIVVAVAVAAAAVAIAATEVIAWIPRTGAVPVVYWRIAGRLRIGTVPDSIIAFRAMAWAIATANRSRDRRRRHRCGQQRRDDWRRDQGQLSIFAEEFAAVFTRAGVQRLHGSLD
jgi:uncharacterized membrane protein